jgi:hypothetical protein
MQANEKIFSSQDVVASLNSLRGYEKKIPWRKLPACEVAASWKLIPRFSLEQSIVGRQGRSQCELSLG